MNVEDVKLRGPSFLWTSTGAILLILDFWKDTPVTGWPRGTFWFFWSVIFRGN